MKVKLDEGAFMPERAHAWDAGADLKAPERFILRAHSSTVINTGVHVEIPRGYVGMVKSKSSLMRDDGIVADGTIDAGYTGSIGVCLFNHSGKHKEFKRGEKIAQLVIMECATPLFWETTEIAGSERGAGGFGSTGR